MHAGFVWAALVCVVACLAYWKRNELEVTAARVYVNPLARLRRRQLDLPLYASDAHAADDEAIRAARLRQQLDVQLAARKAT
eukprot:tig00000663_g2969.t1